MSSKDTFHMEQQKRLFTVRAWQKEAVAKSVLITCLNCEYWDGGGCTLNTTNINKPTPPVLPPPKIIVYGCDYWEQALPF